MNQLTMTNVSLDETVEIVWNQLDNAGLSFGHGTEDAEEEAYWLVLSAVGEALGQEEYDWDRKLKLTEQEAVSNLLQRRISTRKPLAYLLGEAWFAGIPFNIDERALVPRSFMAEWLPAQFTPWVEPSGIHRILDLCCGSGCIGIAAAHYFPDADVVLSDISEDALEVAQSNVVRHELEGRVTTNHGPIFEGLSGTFDLILCNPPYVSEQRMEKLPAEYQNEPSLALAAGQDGLDFIRPFLAASSAFLNEDGVMIVEAGSAGPNVEDVYNDVPFVWLGTAHDEMVLFMLTASDIRDSQEALISRNN